MAWNSNSPTVRDYPAGSTDAARSAGDDIVAEQATLAILRDPHFTQLVKERTSFAWLLSGIMLVVYLAFIFLVAFAHDFMATKIAGNISLGIFLGLAVIVFAFILTGIYVGRANGRFDDLTRELVKGPRQ